MRSRPYARTWAWHLGQHLLPPGLNRAVGTLLDQNNISIEQVQQIGLDTGTRARDVDGQVTSRCRKAMVGELHTRECFPAAV